MPNYKNQKQYISLKLTPSPLTVYTHVTLNDKICHAKLDTGPQINVLGRSISCHYIPSQMSNGWLWKNIKYIRTTVVDAVHMTQNQEGYFLRNKAEQ